MNKPFFAINLFCAALIVLNPLFFDRTLCLAWLNLRVLEIRKVPTIYNAKRNRTNCRKRVRVRRVRAAALKTYSLCIPLYSFCAFIPKTLTRPTYILLYYKPSTSRFRHIVRNWFRIRLVSEYYSTYMLWPAHDVAVFSRRYPFASASPPRRRRFTDAL